VNDPRKAKTLGEAAQNSDGTFNALRALSWLSEVVKPGHGLSLEEVKQIAENVKAEKNGTIKKNS
jgi:hypothetical protein